MEKTENAGRKVRRLTEAEFVFGELLDLLGQYSPDHGLRPEVDKAVEDFFNCEIDSLKSRVSGISSVLRKR